MLYEQIIVPFDGTVEARAAAHIAADLSALFRAPLLLLTSARSDVPADLAELKQRAIGMSTTDAEVWVEAARRPAEAVATAVANHPNPLVVMATHARSSLRRTMFGNIAQDILRTVDAPVLALGPRCVPCDPVDVREVVLSTDGTDTAEAATILAAAWSRALGVRCIVLHVRSPKGAAVDLTRLVTTLKLIGADVETRVIDGDDVVDGILGAVADDSAILVMASHMRHRSDRLTHPSTATRVLHDARVPVLVQSGSATHGARWLCDDLRAEG